MARERLYRPGSRHPKFRPGGRMSENRVAWLRTIISQFVLMKYDEFDEQNNIEPDGEIGPTYVLTIPLGSGRKPISLNLTALTAEELSLTRQFFDLAFDLAEPVVAQRDQVAENAYAEGDDSFARIYRQVPQLVIRPGTEREDSEGVHDRPQDLPDGAGHGGSSDGGVRELRPELAASESEEDRAENDRPPTD